jgi:hypothetical protein
LQRLADTLEREAQVLTQWVVHIAGLGANQQAQDTHTAKNDGWQNNQQYAG